MSRHAVLPICILLLAASSGNIRAQIETGGAGVAAGSHGRWHGRTPQYTRTSSQARRRSANSVDGAGAQTNLYSFLLLFSMGITKGKWSTLIRELINFKLLYDNNAPLTKALPALVQAHPRIYAGLGLRELCDKLYRFNTTHRVADVLHEMFSELPEQAMTPAYAYDHLVRGEVERMPIGQLTGRIAATMLVPYPPGIPTIMPGERFGAQDTPLIESLRIAKDRSIEFPGFELDVHGLIIEQHASGPRYVVEVLNIAADETAANE